MRVVLRAPFDRITGFGNDSVDLALSLSNAGVDVLPWPMALRPGLPQQFADLLTKEPVGPADVALTFAPAFQLDTLRGVNAPVQVGWSMWEWDRLTWAHLRSGSLAWDASYRPWSDDDPPMDHLMVACPMNLTAFRDIDDGVPMSVQPVGIDPKAWPREERNPKGRPLRFGMVGMLNNRKNPFAALYAWKAAKERDASFDAELEMKTSTPGLHPKIEDWAPDVKIHQGVWPKGTLVEWIMSLDVLLCPSRGEGMNKPAMEIQATGGTVIASDWGGHQNWLDDACAYRLDGQLVWDAKMGAQWFEADVEHLTGLILRAHRDRDELADKCAKAPDHIRAGFSWEGVAENVIGTLETLT